MSWTIEQSNAAPITPILRVQAEGSVSTEEVMAQIMEGIGIIKQQRMVGALVDYSKAILEMPLHEIHGLPDVFDANELPRDVKLAIVLPADPKNMHKYTFFDDVATNRGYLVRLYWEPTQALAWLAGG